MPPELDDGAVTERRDPWVGDLGGRTSTNTRDHGLQASTHPGFETRRRFVDRFLRDPQVRWIDTVEAHRLLTERGGSIVADGRDELGSRAKGTPDVQLGTREDVPKLGGAERRTTQIDELHHGVSIVVKRRASTVAS
ncbi:hypothetical protein GCM10027427_15320 [Pseudoclavibacter terrae]